MNIIGIVGTIVGIVSLILTIKTLILVGSIEDALRKEKLSTVFAKRKNKIKTLLSTLENDMKEGNPEILNRMAITHFKEIVIELETYITLFSDDNKEKIKTAHSIVDSLAKQEKYSLNDCNDFENNVFKIKSLINSEVL